LPVHTPLGRKPDGTEDPGGSPFYHGGVHHGFAENKMGLKTALEIYVHIRRSQTMGSESRPESEQRRVSIR